MKKIEWNERFFVADGIVNSQHKKLVECINSLIESLNSEEEEALNESLSFLIDYTLIHFEYEEKLLQKSYPQYYNYQRSKHLEFIESVSKFCIKEMDNRLEVLELVTFLKNWLVNHILNIDKATLNSD